LSPTRQEKENSKLAINLTPSLISSAVVVLSTVLFISPITTFATSEQQQQQQLQQEQQTSATISQQEQKETVSTTAESIPPPSSPRYWDAINSETPSLIATANEKLIDHAVGTINTMYYDNTGGFKFNTKEMYQNWRVLRKWASSSSSGVGGEVTKNDVRKELSGYASRLEMPRGDVFDSREGVLEGLKWVVSTLNDPYSKYLTREELRSELTTKDDGFLGVGAIVEAPTIKSSAAAATAPLKPSSNKDNILTITRAENLPVVTAISPFSPAERAGLVVNDRIVAVGRDNFLGRTRDDVKKTLATKYRAENYAGAADLTVAKPVFAAGDGGRPGVLRGYRLSHVTLLTESLNPFPFERRNPAASGGNNICRWEILTPMGSIFESGREEVDEAVGYIRITRFSKAATAGYVEAVEALEALGAKSYIIDVRNNYGGVIQEAMLTASTLLRDPKSVLCYTLNSRGGFTPHDAEEFIIDKRYPGYLLSSESTTTAIDHVKRFNPTIFTDGWTPPSSYASLHEQGVKRHSYASFVSLAAANTDVNNKQKRVAILMNEGTASSAEVFVSSLRDNGRTVALVGAKTYGKGLIQHTFPMPDGGGLRLTVAEYLTPALKHVTKVGGANFDQDTGELVGGGVKPDVYCQSKGIPSNPGADICVGLALDALKDADFDDIMKFTSGTDARLSGGDGSGSL